MLPRLEFRRFRHTTVECQIWTNLRKSFHGRTVDPASQKRYSSDNYIMEQTHWETNSQEDYGAENNGLEQESMRLSSEVSSGSGRYQIHYLAVFDISILFL